MLLLPFLDALTGLGKPVRKVKETMTSNAKVTGLVLAFSRPIPHTREDLISRSTIMAKRQLLDCESQRSARPSQPIPGDQFPFSFADSTAIQTARLRAECGLLARPPSCRLLWPGPFTGHAATGHQISLDRPSYRLPLCLWPTCRLRDLRSGNWSPCCSTHCSS